MQIGTDDIQSFFSSLRQPAPQPAPQPNPPLETNKRSKPTRQPRQPKPKQPKQTRKPKGKPRATTRSTPASATPSATLVTPSTPSTPPALKKLFLSFERLQETPLSESSNPFTPCTPHTPHTPHTPSSPLSFESSFSRQHSNSMEEYKRYTSSRSPSRFSPDPPESTNERQLGAYMRKYSHYHSLADIRRFERAEWDFQYLLEDPMLFCFPGETGLLLRTQYKHTIDTLIRRFLAVYEMSPSSSYSSYSLYSSHFTASISSHVRLHARDLLLLVAWHHPLSCIAQTVIDDLQNNGLTLEQVQHKTYTLDNSLGLQPYPFPSPVASMTAANAKTEAEAEAAAPVASTLNFRELVSLAYFTRSLLPEGVVSTTSKSNQPTRHHQLNKPHLFKPQPLPPTIHQALCNAAAAATAAATGEVPLVGEVTPPDLCDRITVLNGVWCPPLCNLQRGTGGASGVSASQNPFDACFFKSFALTMWQRIHHDRAPMDASAFYHAISNVQPGLLEPQIKFY